MRARRPADRGRGVGMERKQTRPYRVISLYTGRVFDFTSAKGVAEYLFVFCNFDLAHYPVFKYGRRFKQPRDVGSTSEYARALEAF